MSKKSYLRTAGGGTNSQKGTHMSEQAKGKTRPEIKGKVLAIMPEWRNAAGTFWKQEIVVETGYRFPNPVKVSFQKEATSHLEGVEEGDAVIVPYALNGRKWDGPNGTQFFVDVVGLDLQKIVGSGGGTAPAAETKPVVGCTAATAIETWAKYHGDDKAGFAEYCKRLKPGKASKAYTIGDWADVVNAIEADAQKADAPDGPEDDDPDNLPF